MSDETTRRRAEGPDLRAAVEEVADRLCAAVDGDIGFSVTTTSEDESVQKLCLLVNFMLETARRAVHEAEASKQHLEAILSTVPSAVFTVDTEQRFTSWNTMAEKIFGIPAAVAIGQKCTEALHCSTCLKGCGLYEPSVPKPIISKECTVTTPDGRVLTVSKNVAELRDETGQVVGGTESVIDLTDQRHLEAELRHAQKLEAVGRLAAGVAHEINTPIQFVSDSVHFLKDAHEDLRALAEQYRAVLASAEGLDDETREELAEAEEDADLDYLDEEAPKAFARTLDGAERVATIVRAMKEFGRADTREKTAADLNRAIESTLTVCRNEYKYVADVETTYGELPPVICHVGDVNQVMLNLVVNAAHAIADKGEEGERGVIRVRTRAVGDHAVVEVEDTGGGIPEEVRPRIFDPFFTTKEVGRGSGQGLAIARSIIVDKHGGEIDVESEEGRGTTFRLRLPVAGHTPGSSPPGETPPAIV